MRTNVSEEEIENVVRIMRRLKIKEFTENGVTIRL